MKKKTEQLIELAFGHSMADVFMFASESAICEESCPASEECPQKVKNKTKAQLLSYCERQLKKWWKSQ